MGCSNELTFYNEWLLLDKNDFRILAFIAYQQGDFTGAITDIRNFLGLSKQASHNQKIKESIANLTEQQYIECSKSGNTYTLHINPKETQIVIKREHFDIIKSKNYNIKDSVSWEMVLKTYIYLLQHNEELLTNHAIAEAVDSSESTVSSAQKALKSIGAIISDVNKKKIAEDNYVTLGHTVTTSAFWDDIKYQFLVFLYILFKSKQKLILLYKNQKMPKSDNLIKRKLNTNRKPHAESFLVKANQQR